MCNEASGFHTALRLEIQAASESEVLPSFRCPNCARYLPLTKLTRAMHSV